MLRQFMDTFELSQATIVGVLLRISKNAGVSAGVLLADECESLTSVTLNVNEGASLGTELAMLHEQMPALTWSENSGVIGFEVNGATLRGRLARQIRAFSWNSSEVTASVVARLLVASHLSDDLGAKGYEPFAKIAPGLMFTARKTGQPVQPEQDPGVGVQHVKSGKISDVLNEVVRARPASMWVYEEMVCRDKRYFDLNGY